MTRALLLLFLLAACGPQLDRVCVERVPSHDACTPPIQ